MLTIAVTGHRPNQMGPGYGYDDARPWRALQTRVADAFQAIAEERGESAVRVITGGAQGADQVAFWAAEELKTRGLKVTNTVFVPFDGQESRWRENGLFGQADWRAMLARADESVVVTRPRPTDRGSVVRALHARNDAMMAAADVVVAVTHLDPNAVANASGGTAQAMRTCVTRGIPLRTVRP